MRRPESWLFEPPEGQDPGEVSEMARELERRNQTRLAATAWDRAYGLDPDNEEVSARRANILARLAVEHDGLSFRYIPAGTFLMGSETGDHDERPVHPVTVDEYWMMDIPVSWGLFCRVLDQEPPPHAIPRDADTYFARLVAEIGPDSPVWENRGAEDVQRFYYYEANKLRYQYSHDGGPGQSASSEGVTFEEAPVVAVSWQESRLFCRTLSNDRYHVRLPTEAEWERAARGGFFHSRYPWGDDPPDESRCDFDRMEKPGGDPNDRPWFGLQPSRRFPPNGYGLYAMSGGVWEWTGDRYDARYYAHSPARNPTGPARGDQHVLRGGSWTDCAEAVTVSFRMALTTEPQDRGFGDYFNPNIGFRVVLKER